MTDLRDLAGAVDPALAEHAAAEPGPPRFVAGSGRDIVLEAVYEGYLLHYGAPRVFEGMDPDLRLLAGDAMYAFGLARLADAGDVEAVAELADLISACARAHAEGRPEDAEAHWERSAGKLGERA